MEINRHIADMVSGDSLEGFYILRQASLRSTQTGKAFLSATLSDATGSIDATMWDYSGPVGPEDIGTVIKVRGDVSTYRGALQLTISRIRKATENDTYTLSDLVPSAPIDTEAAWNDIRCIIDTITDADYKKICDTILRQHEKSFRTIPAAKSVHHGFLNGLLMHTANMLQMADFLSDRYYDVLDRNLLLAGTLLHDIAKSREFDFSPLGLVTDYSTRGKLIGHLVDGAAEVADVARRLNVPEEKSLLLQHMLLSHHGQPEFGACVLPQTAEAELLSYIDLIDSRMEIYSEAFRAIPEGQFTDKVFALDNKRLFKHPMSD